MKKYFFILYLLLQVNAVMACDGCGVSVSSAYQGILPQFTKHFIGVRYQFRYFSSTSFITPQQPVRNNDYYHTWNVYARLSPHKRVQIFLNVPVNYFIKLDNGIKRELAGPGDIWAYCQYQFIRTPDSSKFKARHSLMAGAGIKLPTGRYNLYDDVSFYDRNMQPGTGSWDALIGANYTVRWKGWGMNMEANAKISTLNPDRYLYGHQVSAGAKGFYWAKIKSTSLVFAVGAQYDYRNRDFYLQQYQPDTGGSVLNLQASADVYIKKWAIGVDCRIPVFSQLGGGLIQPGLQLSSQILFMF